MPPRPTHRRATPHATAAVLGLLVGCVSERGPAGGPAPVGPGVVSPGGDLGSDTASEAPDRDDAGPTRRVPAEWEPQEALWLQWPRPYERAYEPALAQVVATVLQHEDVHVLFHNAITRQRARTALRDHGGLTDADLAGQPNAQGFALTWHDIDYDNAWMRDNGPVWVEEDGALRIQDWGFDAWGDAFGAIPHADDDAVPRVMGARLGVPVDTVDLVHERGNLEVDGQGTVLANRTVILDPERNPGLTEARAREALETLLGAEQVVFVEGVPTGDLTRGHIDGIARFLPSGEVVVADCSPTSACQPGDADDALYDAAADAIEAAGLPVIRWPFAASVTHEGHTFDTDYMNWLVGNGFVVTVGFDHPEADAAARAQLEAWFPGRAVYVIEMLDSWVAGGGVHCHTNDQPAAP